MKARILKHKNLEGWHGMVLSGTLYRTGPSIVPQLFNTDCTKEWLEQRIKSIDKPFVQSLDEFELVDVIIIEQA